MYLFIHKFIHVFIYITCSCAYSTMWAYSKAVTLTVLFFLCPNYQATNSLCEGGKNIYKLRLSSLCVPSTFSSLQLQVSPRMNHMPLSGLRRTPPLSQWCVSGGSALVYWQCVEMCRNTGPYTRPGSTTSRDGFHTNES